MRSLAGALPATVAAEAAQHSPPHTSIAANLFQVSVWASQRNLCMLAAFAQYAQKLAGQLAPLGPHETEVEKVIKLLAKEEEGRMDDKRLCCIAQHALNNRGVEWCGTGAHLDVTA